MKPYTAVCIGGSIDRGIISADSYEVFVPVRTWKPVFTTKEIDPSEKTFMTERYRLRFLPTGTESLAVLIHEDVTIHDALKKLLDHYSNDATRSRT